MYTVDFWQLYLTCAISTTSGSCVFSVKGQKMSNQRQIQDRVKSRTRPWNKGLSRKIQNGWTPYLHVNMFADLRICWTDKNSDHRVLCFGSGSSCSLIRFGHTARVAQQCLHTNCLQMIQKKQCPLNLCVYVSISVSLSVCTFVYLFSVSMIVLSTVYSFM